MGIVALSVVALAALAVISAATSRWLLFTAAHRSLHGHPQLARWFARQVRLYEFTGEEFFHSDGAPPVIVDARRAGFDRIASTLHRNSPRSCFETDDLTPDVSDLQFTAAHRVPFPYQSFVSQRLPVGSFLSESHGVLVSDLDGHTAYDVAGSYGLNVFGYDFYKDCIDRGAERVRDLGPVLGAYHPLVSDNVRRLKAVSGLDEVSFHMSGTEAVMQAVRLARFHTGRSHLVRFCGAYHGWWDDVQPGVGTPGTARDVYTLEDLNPASLRVLRRRRNIACVLVNPLQALHPNAPPSSDASLVSGARSASFNRARYTQWLQELRQICSARSIPLIFDEVFLGFRVAFGGAQEYFGVKADLVVYGKTLGGGLPVGVVCGRSNLMKRFRDEWPLDICFARGTFNTHPYVMGAMNEFLRRLDDPNLRHSYDELDGIWNTRAELLNARLAHEQLPVRVANLTSIWTICYAAPSRYHWLFQYYLRAEGLALPWIGTGRLIFSHIYTDRDFEAVADRVVAAARAMRADGWWWHPAGWTTADIERQVLREMIDRRLGRRPRAMEFSDREPWSPRARHASNAAAPCSTAPRRETDP
jgi:glutamate-1-semialdehyde 2,1-aminomutase